MTCYGVIAVTFDGSLEEAGIILEAFLNAVSGEVCWILPLRVSHTEPDKEAPWRNASYAESGVLVVTKEEES